MNTTPTESQEQIMLVQYLDILERQWKVLWFTGSWNGQFQKSIQVKMKMKREWIRAWMPDMMIVFPDYLVFIELKRKKWWKATPEQLHAIEAINKMWDSTNTVSAYIAYWFDEAKEIVNKYIIKYNSLK